MDFVKIKFIVEVEDANSEITDLIEEEKEFEKNDYGYENYKNKFGNTYQILLTKINKNNISLISIIAEIVNNKLSRTGKLLFIRPYKDLKEIQKDLEEVISSDFKSPFCIWRNNLNREFGIKLEA